MPYRVPGARNRWEERVQAAGYPWTATVTLNPPHIVDPVDHPFRLANRLNPHGHSSPNTHFIIRGRLTLDCFVGEYGVHSETIEENGEQQEISLPAGLRYSGRPGPEGATFVEGHSILSPNTAERYERRGVIVWFPDESGQTREEWIAQQAVDRQDEVNITRINTRPIRGW